LCQAAGSIGRQSRGEAHGEKNGVLVVTVQGWSSEPVVELVGEHTPESFVALGQSPVNFDLSKQRIPTAPHNPARQKQRSRPHPQVDVPRAANRLWIAPIMFQGDLSSAGQDAAAGQLWVQAGTGASLGEECADIHGLTNLIRRPGR
jgi:hypothetical protein